FTNINEYPKKYEEYFNDYLPFRNELVKLKNLNDIFVFKNVFNRIVFLGKEKWLFHKWNNTYSFNEEQLETAKNNLVHFRDELKKKNIDFIFMVCPDKQFIYSEYMPDYIKIKPDNKGTDFVIEYIKNNTDIKVVYPKEELLKYKDKYQLYYKYDTHWNNLGAYIGYSELMKSLNIHVDNIDNVNIKSLNGNERFNFDIHHYNDMAYLLSLNSLKYYNDDKTYIISNYIIKNYETNYYISSENFSFNSKSYKSKDNIMIIRDSYAMNMYDYIATGFKQSEFIHIDTFKNKNITEYNPDIVVFESVERFLKVRMLYVIPNYKIEEINED
ncbi:alginate O-acetyltransferase AlgX-related protein, partial [Brachyspira aalborgi]|uniref:alginate O-acetyltransferase AlgX-related protein n=1 Tax=Brachyspira aalborgi TaxID=29522 RepID=UPI003F583DC3